MKKFIIIVCIIAAICFLGYLGQNTDLSNLGKGNLASNSNSVTEKKASNNANDNNTKKEVANNTSNESKTNTTNTTEKDNENKENTTKTNEKENEVVSANDEDKAKALAMKEYGTTDGVYFRIEQIEGNGVYIISVRDNETTRDLAWYKVNVNDGTVK